MCAGPAGSGGPNTGRGGAIALEAVAGDATRHDVVPAFVSPAGHGDHVIECELAGREAVSAILAAVVVARVDVGAGEGNVRKGTFHPDVTEQTKHRRELHPDRDAADLPVVDGDDLHLALEEKGDGLLPGHDPQGLVGGVEDEGVFHEGRTAKNCAPGPEGCQGGPTPPWG